VTPEQAEGRRRSAFPPSSFCILPSSFPLHVSPQILQLSD
jgi:hypothetical protein